MIRSTGSTKQYMQMFTILARTGITTAISIQQIYVFALYLILKKKTDKSVIFYYTNTHLLWNLLEKHQVIVIVVLVEGGSGAPLDWIPPL